MAVLKKCRDVSKKTQNYKREESYETNPGDSTIWFANVCH